MTTIWKVPLVPFVAGTALVAIGAIGAVALEPEAIVFSLLGLAGLGYQRDVSIHGDRSTE